MRRFIYAFAPVVIFGVASASTSWDKCYDAGVASAHAGQWADARVQFELAGHAHRGDTDKPIMVGGSIFERHKWRNGAAYSPNFLAAYCGMKYATMLSGADRTKMLQQVQTEFEDLLKHGQACKETFFFLDETYMLAGDVDKRMALGQRYSTSGSSANWKVDTDAVLEEDEAVVAQLPTPEAPPKPEKRNKHSREKVAKPAEVKAADVAPVAPAPAPAPKEQPKRNRHRDDKRNAPDKATPVVAKLDTTVAQTGGVQPIPLAKIKADPIEVTAPTQPKPAQPQIDHKVAHPASDKHPLMNPSTPLVGIVPPAGDKYALIIGNSDSKFEGDVLPFAGDDAQTVRQALITNAGYLDQNVEVVVNTTSQQLAATINALASRVHDKDTVFIYYTGVGVNIDGKDYLAGVDCDVNSDAGSMLAKNDVYRAFMEKGTRIFAFFQANRHIENGHYFGSELPLVGSVSQMQATIPGGDVYGLASDGKKIGLFTKALVAVLGDIRSNRVPINDFGWQLFYKMRRGDTGQFGGSSNQSPSLPVLTNMASDARF